MEFDCHDAATLLDRFAKSERETVFLVGAALSMPSVPGVAGILDLIRALYSEGSETRRLFDQQIAQATNPYAEAFRFVNGRGGATEANRVVREAVLKARRPDARVGLGSAAEGLRGDCERLERDAVGWKLTPALGALGRIAVEEPVRYGSTVLTTNFDPLIEVAIQTAGGDVLRTVLDKEGGLDQSEGRGCRVIHFHGDWFRSNTLHTHTQLGQDRPNLRASLAHILGEKKNLAVFGYSGWDDIIMRSLHELLKDDGDVEVIWCFREPDAAAINHRYQHLARFLSDGVGQGRVAFYQGIDAHAFLPGLLELLRAGRVNRAAVQASKKPVGISRRAISVGIAALLVPLGGGLAYRKYHPRAPKVTCDVVVERAADLPDDLGAADRENLLVAQGVGRICRDIDESFDKGDGARIVGCVQRLKDLDMEEFAFSSYPFVAWAYQKLNEPANAKEILGELEKRMKADLASGSGRFSQAKFLNDVANNLGEAKKVMTDPATFQATDDLQVEALRLAQDALVRSRAVAVQEAAPAPPPPPIDKPEGVVPGGKADTRPTVPAGHTSVPSASAPSSATEVSLPPIKEGFYE